MASLIRRYLNRAVVVWAASLLVVACSKDDQKPGGGLDEGSVAIELFEASETTVDAGEPVVLRWKTRNAESIEIVDSVGGVIGIPPGEDGLPPVEEGEVTVHPEVTTTFILTAKGSAGSATELLQITVRGSEVPRTTVSLEADSDRVDAGQPVVLTWSAQNANRVILREGRTVILDEREQKSGTLEVRPGVTTTYAIEAMGIGPSATDEVVVEVQPVIEAFFVATEGPVRSNSQIELRWETLGAAALRVETDEGFRYDVEEADLRKGSLLTAAGAGTFRLVATSGELRAEEEASVEISDLPLIVNFGAGPNVTASEEMPAEVTLTWNVRFATEIEIEAIPGGNLPVPVGMLEEGSLDVPVTGPVSFRLVASNEEGSVEETAEVIVAPFPEVVAFTASHERAGFGEEIELTWETRGAVEVFITRPEGRLPIDPGLVTGSTTLAVSQSTQFVLAARNELGVEVHAFVDVTVGNPIISRFDAPLRVAPGGAVALEWEVIGGVELDVLASAGSTSHCSTKDPEQIESGSCSVTAPTEGDEVTYTLLVKDGVGGTSTEVAVVGTHDGPIIESFNAARSVITEGETVVLSWVVSDDYLGNPPELSLVDDRGNTYDMRGALAVGGISTDPIPAGKTVFTLEASTAASQRKAKRTAQVDAYARPVILAFESDPPYATAAQPNVTLSWQTENVASLQIYPLSRYGEPGSAIHTSTDPASNSKGTLPVTPTLAYPDYRIVVENTGGFTIEQDLQVGVEPAKVLTFTASPNELLEGGTTTLEWTTERADYTTLEPLDRWVESFEPYIDLSQRPTATQLFSLSGIFEGQRLVFPDDFVFPYFGVDVREAVINASGNISFTRKLGSTYVRAPMPMELDNNGAYDTFTYVHLAPYWTDLDPVGRQAEYWWEMMEGRDGQRELVIQFKNLSSAIANDANFNFNVVLREDGSFDFRYGEMSSPSDPAHAMGRAVSVGFQDHLSSYGAKLAFNEEFPGGFAWRSFHFPTKPSKPVYEEIEAQLVQLSPNAQRHHLSTLNFFVDLDPMPDGFVFRHAGHDRTALRIYANGVASFKRGSGSVSYSTARELLQGLQEGLSSSTRGIDLAPYWTNSFPLTPGELLTEVMEIDGRRVLVAHWEDFQLRSPNDPSAPPSSLNYQVLLWEDGIIEYRYGLMAHSGDQELADGKGASIGFQGGATTTNDGHGPVWGASVLWDSPIAGGLSGKAFRFYQTEPLPPAGQYVTSPRGTVTYQLTAHNAQSQGTATRQVQVHAISDIELWAEPAFPLPNEPLTLHWRTANIVSMLVEMDGQPLYHVPAEELAVGSYHFSNGLPRGVYDFDFRGVGAMAQSTSESIQIAAGDPFYIISFTGPDFPLAVDEESELHWEVEGADSILIEDSSGTPVYSGTEASGSIEIKPSHSELYTLTALSMGRKETAERLVLVRTVGIDNLTASKTEIEAGEQVTLTWDTIGDSTPQYTVLSTVETSDAFIDISGDGEKLSTWNPGSTSPTRGVNLPFPFPFMGGVYQSISIGRGLISVGDTEILLSTVQRFPSGATSGGPRIGAFWDTALRTQANNPPDSGVFLKHVRGDGSDPDAYIIQWNNVRTNTPSADIDLNFQIILYDDGAFDIRYGTMSGSTEAAQTRANGGNASIGYQDHTRQLGHSIGYMEAIEGGLSNRSFRTSYDTSSPLTVTLDESATQTICVSDEHYSECKRIHIVVVEEGMLAITEMMMEPSGGPGNQWFEVRNVGKDSVDLNGKVLRRGEEEHTLDFGHPFHLAPSEYAVFGASSSIPNVSVDYVYGPDFGLGWSTQSGALTIHFGTKQLGGVEWLGGEFKAGESMELNPLHHKRGVLSRVVGGTNDWCPGSFDIGGGVLGSPGRTGVTCTQNFYDVDLLSDMPFIDISESGTSIPGLAAYSRKRQIPGGVGFDFPFFGKVKASPELWGISTGILTFTSIGEQAGAPWPGSMFTGGGEPLPTSKITPNFDAGIYPFWGPQRVHPETQVYYQRLEVDGTKVVVVQWSESSPQPSTTSLGRITYQAQLWENGDIVFAYGSLEGKPEAFGKNAYIGLEEEPGRKDGNGNLTSPYVQAVGDEPVLVPFSSMLFRPRSP